MKRLQAVTLALSALIVGVMAGRIFNQWVVLPGLAGAATIGLGYLLRNRSVLTTTLVLTVGSAIWTGLAVVAAGGRNITSLQDAFGPAIRVMLSSQWPSPPRPELIGWVTLLIAIGSTTTAILATRQGARLLPQVPILLVAVVFVMLSSPGGVHPADWGVLFGSIVLGLALSDEHAGHRLRDLNIPTMAAVTGLLVVVIGGFLPNLQRYSPRHVAPIGDERDILPVEAFAAMRYFDNPVSFFRIEIEEVGRDEKTPSAADIARRADVYRVVGYSTYDGTSWNADASLQEVGSFGTPKGDDDVTYKVEVLGGRLTEIPLAGDPESVSTPIIADGSRDVVLLRDRPVVGTTYRVTSKGWEAPDDAVVQPRRQSDSDLPFADVAKAVTGADGNAAAPSLDQLQTLERVMRNDWQLEEDGAVGGLQQELLLSFVSSEAPRGTRSQFVSAFALLARSLGANARVAAGFEYGPDGRLSSEEATIWPEVYMVDRGWVRFDPVPAEVTPPDEDRESVTVRGQNPGRPPPPEPAIETPALEEDELEQTETGETQPRWVGIAQRVGALSLMVVAVVAVYVIAIGVFKYRRRRRWLRAERADQRVRGGWAEVTSELVDAGMKIDPSWTDSEIVAEAQLLVGPDARQLARLGNAARAATFSFHREEVVVGVDATLPDDIAAIGRSIDARCNRRQRIRRRLSTRSIRRKTRSPVAAELRLD